MFVSCGHLVVYLLKALIVRTKNGQQQNLKKKEEKILHDKPVSHRSWLYVVLCKRKCDNCSKELVKSYVNALIKPKIRCAKFLHNAVIQSKHLWGLLSI